MSTPIAPAPRSPVFISANPVTSEQSAKSAQGFGKAPISVPQIQAIDEQVITLLAKAATEQAGEVNTTKPQAPGTPELRAADLPRLMRAVQQGNPGIPGQPLRLTPEAVLMMLSLQLSGVITEENTRSLTAQLEIMKARLAARAASASELAEAIRLAQALVDSGLGDVGLAEGELAAAKEALRQAQAEVARLEQALADAPPEEQEAIRAQLEQAKAHAGVQQANVNAAHNRLNQALAALDSALKDLEAFEQAAEQLNPTPGAGNADQPRALTNQAALTELLARLQNIIAEANDRKMAKDTEFAQAVIKAREAESMRRAEEYQREKEKAAQAQKTMGCIGKVVGWVITAVSVVAAPFTGGASMALAGIGLALAIGEELGLDVMGKVLEPVMKVVMDLVKVVGGVLGDVLKAIGVPADIADKIKDVLAVVAVAAMVVAIAVLSRNAAGTVAVQAITKAVTEAVTQAISKALPAIIKSAAHAAKSAVDDVAKSLSNAMAKVAGTNADTLAMRAGQATTAANAMQFVNQSAQGGVAIMVADMNVNAAEHLAEMELSLAEAEIFRELIQKILNYFLQTNELIADLFKQMSSVHSSLDETANFITSRTGRTMA